MEGLGVGTALDRYQWSRLNHLQLGRYAEYLAKMEFTLFGFDVYTSEVDDKGIDFVIRRGISRYFDVSVKSSRNGNYIFMHKDKFLLRESLLLVAVHFFDGKKPDIYLIPAMVWKEPKDPFVSRDYVNSTKSKPEWGLNYSKKRQADLEIYRFEYQIKNLIQPTLADAIALAAQVHVEDSTEDGLPLLTELLQLAGRVESEDAKIVALLHRTVTDPYTLNHLRAAGYKEDIVLAIQCLNKAASEAQEHYIHRVTQNTLAKSVKRAELKRIIYGSLSVIETGKMPLLIKDCQAALSLLDGN